MASLLTPVSESPKPLTRLALALTVSGAMPWNHAALEALRLGLKIPSQRAAARLSGVNATQISEWETGATVPRIDKLLGYLDGIGATLYDLADASELANGRTPSARTSPTPADFEQRAAEPLNLASLDVVTAKIRDLRDALNSLPLDPPRPSLVPSTKGEPKP